LQYPEPPVIAAHPVLIGFCDEYFGELAAHLQHSRQLGHGKVRYWKPFSITITNVPS
jgi:hypothetical protein